MSRSPAGSTTVRSTPTNTSLDGLRHAHGAARGGTLAQSPRRPARVRAPLAALALLLTPAQLAAQDQPREPPAIAFVRVTVVPMDRERVDADQTVLVQGDRIVAVGPADRVRIPEGALAIDGAGRYLVPGLTDAHVHVTTDMPWARAREQFGEAPLYLAYGITTVVNLHGTPAQLEWKRQLARGELIGPTLYTSGEHVNEPRVITPADVRREVQTQASDGYDVIKIHEVWNTVDGLLTRTGLSRPAYLELNAAARERGMPIVGHAPVNLGFDALLEARQPLSHLEALLPVYFFPVASSRGLLAANLAALLILGGVAIVWIADARRRRSGPAEQAPAPRRLRLPSAAVVAGGLAAAAVQLDESVRSSLPRPALLMLFGVLTGFVGTATAALIAALAALRRHGPPSTPPVLQAALVAAAGALLTTTLALFWMPSAWRYTDRGIDAAATQLRSAGISVQTTLSAGELAAGGAAAWTRAKQDPAIGYLAPDTRRRWQRQPPPRRIPPAIHGVVRRLTTALHRAGVLLIAGSDAMGRPLVAPGSSLHRELDLLARSGLSPYDAIRTATVNPAIFLGRQREFGTIGVGLRADLILVEGNPLQDLQTLRQPLGVMVRGRWLTREQLQERLQALASMP